MKDGFTPPSVELNGETYYRADVARKMFAGRPREPERTYSVAELNAMSGMPKTSIYRAMDDGRLGFVRYNGSSRRRVPESAWWEFIGRSSE